MKLGDDAVAVRDEDGFPTLGKTHVLAELVLQHLEADGAHAAEVVSGRYLGNDSRRPPSVRR
ncbi:hypothetical protein K2Z84_00815 [Candidatus Binatia bacterium]|nr:hypothetical protein [Candidatus Binatia bacterium]